MNKKDLEKLAYETQRLFSKKLIKQKDTLLDFGGKTLRIKMFRSDDIKTKLTKDDVEGLCRSFALDIPTEINNFLELLLKFKIIMKLQRQDENLIGEKLKWPKKMYLSSTQNLDEKRVIFFSFVDEKKVKSWRAYLIVCLVLIAFLYPIWPFFFRLIVFYICFYFLVAFLVFQILRILIFYTFRLGGYEFWILPNINENNMSLKPYYTFQRCSDGSLAIFLRGFLFFLSILILIYISLSSQVRGDINYFFQQIHDDALEYGLDKIKFNYTANIDRSVSYENIMKELDEKEEKEKQDGSSFNS